MTESTLTLHAESRYNGHQHPVMWERSLYHPQIVFAAGPTFTNCKQCAFSNRPEANACSAHPCKGGVWVTEQEAVVLRLES